MTEKLLDPIVERVQAAFDASCHRLAPLVDGARLLLGCSAGGDSMALLHLVAAAAPRRHWRIAVAHLDHSQRPESGEEAAWLAGQVEALGMPFLARRLDDALAQSSPLSEEVMREARHACFRHFAREWRADAVLLAHQADDRAETLLIRLFAGSGPTGLGSIRPLQPLNGLMLVRPLLDVRREELRDYLRANGREWRDDPSNEDQTTKRAWIRHALLPTIGGHLGQDISPRLARAAELISDEADALANACGLMLDELASRPGEPMLGRLDLEHPMWDRAGPLLRRQLMRHWLWRLRPRGVPPALAPLTEAMEFVRANRRAAELRTVDGILIVNCRHCLLAFDPETTPEQRSEAASRELRPAE